MIPFFLYDLLFVTCYLHVELSSKVTVFFVHKRNLFAGHGPLTKMSNGVNGSSTADGSPESRNPSQRYLSTRGEDYDV